ncbi:hypothetical protein KVR01_012301 [Diaporthe batatas]|uniref:uncharacterized protein n=1 Tax=Diaporthe batatas TaxID=748121 RepID=UPI001D03F052|nr:uncharacterized protein KVR01_012301 [Diaporthe batatas]KAG8158029.1 hypothetical protein KVR01_012301 [Diaporthe batatas]
MNPHLVSTAPLNIVSKVTKDPFPLLELPIEIRNIVYEYVLFEPGRVDRRDVEQRLVDIYGDGIEIPTGMILGSRELLDQHLVDIHGYGIKIPTNILLASRQLFEEARNVLIGAQLVKVNTYGWKNEALRLEAARNDKIPMFHKMYGEFCLLEHTIVNRGFEEMDMDPDSTFIIRKRDVFRFCGGIPGLDLDSYVPQMLHGITHGLQLLNPEARELRAPFNIPMRVPGHRRLLEEYQRALAGCRNVYGPPH